jgi:hypothetical protein
LTNLQAIYLLDDFPVAQESDASFIVDDSTHNAMNPLAPGARGFPFRTSVSSCRRSSPLNLTPYLFTELSFASILASIANSSDGKRKPGRHVQNWVFPVAA